MNTATNPTAVPAVVPTPTLEVVNGQIMATTLDIAKIFGKEHKNVLRDIEALDVPQEFTKLNFEPSEYKDSTGRKLPMVNMTRDGFTILVMGFTGKEAMKYKLAYIDAFNKMEAKLFPQALPSPFITPAQQNQIQQAMAAKFPEGKHRPYAWSRFNNHFHIAKYSQLDASLFEEALNYVATMPVSAKALPEPAAPVIPTFEHKCRQYATLKDLAEYFGRKRSWLHLFIQRNKVDLGPVKIKTLVPMVGLRHQLCLRDDKFELLGQLLGNTGRSPKTNLTPMIADPEVYAEAEAAKGTEKWWYDQHYVTKAYMKDIYAKHDELNAKMKDEGMERKPSKDGIELAYFLELGMYLCHEFPKMAREVMKMTLESKEARFINHQIGKIGDRVAANG